MDSRGPRSSRTATVTATDQITLKVAVSQFTMMLSHSSRNRRQHHRAARRDHRRRRRGVGYGARRHGRKRPKGHHHPGQLRIPLRVRGRDSTSLALRVHFAAADSDIPQPVREAELLLLSGEEPRQPHQGQHLRTPIFPPPFCAPPDLCTFWQFHGPRAGMNFNGKSSNGLVTTLASDADLCCQQTALAADQPSKGTLW